MLRLILEYQEKGDQALDAGANLSDVIALPVRKRVAPVHPRIGNEALRAD